MAQLILHTGNIDREKLEQERLFATAKMTKQERIKYAFKLMSLSKLFKKGPLKSPEGKGIVLSKNK